MKNEYLLHAVLALVVVFLTTVVVFKAQIRMVEDHTQYCNEKYGEGNWTLEVKKPTSIWEWLYLGEVYECVSCQEEER